MLKRIARRLGVLLFKAGLDEEMAEEFRFHLELEIESNLRKGMSPREARRQALISFGGVERFRERGREARGGLWLEEISRDLRLAFRGLRRSSAFTGASVLVLGIGVGAVSLMFSIFNTVVLQPLPYPEPEELTWLWAENAEGAQSSIPYPDYAEYRAGADAFEALGAYLRFQQTRIFSGAEEAEPLVTYRISANLFTAMGVLPALGRSFLPEEEVSGEANVLILSHGFWQSRFGADPDVIGVTLPLDGEPVEVVGVMPSEFEFPDGAQAWLPLERDAQYAQGREENNFFVVGRLRSGTTVQQAQAQLDVIATNIAAAYPQAMDGWRVRLVSLHERLFGSARESILILMAIVSLVPLVAAANLASLFLTRAVARRAELATRLAMGASRGRVIRFLLAESLVVAVAGGGLGLLIGYGGATLLRNFAPGVLPRLGDIHIDGMVLSVTLLAALLMVPLFGLIPARRGSDLRVGEVIRGGTGSGPKRQEWYLRSGLVVAQVALSLMLLLGSGLLLKSLVNLQATPTGVAEERVLGLQALLPAFRYDTPGDLEQAWRELETRLQSVPGVSDVGLSDRAPLSGAEPTNTVYAQERPPVSGASALSATRRFISPGYFSALEIPLRSGRLLEDADRWGEIPVAVINETLARRHFPGEDPLGQTLVMEWEIPYPLEVVGVVADVREGGVGLPPPAIVYLPPRRDYDMLDVVVATPDDPSALASTVARVIRELDEEIVVSGVEPLEAWVSRMLFEPRLRSAVVGAFALAALVLTLIGLYGLLAYYVQHRGRELSVRLALGASHGNVTILVLRKAVGMVGLGVGLGVAGAMVGGRIVRSVLFGVSSTDPAVLISVSVLVALVGIGAGVLPALKANRMDPVETLKAE